MYVGFWSPLCISNCNQSSAVTLGLGVCVNPPFYSAYLYNRQGWKMIDCLYQAVSWFSLSSTVPVCGSDGENPPYFYVRSKPRLVPVSWIMFSVRPVLSNGEFWTTRDVWKSVKDIFFPGDFTILPTPDLTNESGWWNAWRVYVLSTSLFLRGFIGPTSIPAVVYVIRFKMVKWIW